MSILWKLASKALKYAGIADLRVDEVLASAGKWFDGLATGWKIIVAGGAVLIAAAGSYFAYEYSGWPSLREIGSGVFEKVVGSSSLIPMDGFGGYGQEAKLSLHEDVQEKYMSRDDLILELLEEFNDLQRRMSRIEELLE